jgi:hypothetical protein
VFGIDTAPFAPPSTAGVLVRGVVDGGDGVLGSGTASGPGDRSIVGEPLSTADRTMGRSATGSAAGGAETEMAPMGAPRSARRDDDEDRVSHYLQPPDANELFGVAERAVLPVIGE